MLYFPPHQLFSQCAYYEEFRRGVEMMVSFVGAQSEEIRMLRWQFLVNLEVPWPNPTQSKLRVFVRGKTG
jgi:hypothetical protein